MSSYIHFFVRKGDVFAPIATYGRSTRIFDCFAGAPWEKIRAVSADELREASEGLRIDEPYIEQEIARAQNRIKTISSFSDSIADKLAAISDEEDMIAELRENLEELREAQSFVRFLRDVAAEAEYDGEGLRDIDHYVYVGMECGTNVCAQDVVGE